MFSTVQQKIRHLNNRCVAIWEMKGSNALHFNLKGDDVHYTYHNDAKLLIVTSGVNQRYEIANYSLKKAIKLIKKLIANNQK